MTTPAPMQNIRAVSFRVDALLVPSRCAGKPYAAAPAAVRTLEALRFLGLRMATIESEPTANNMAQASRPWERGSPTRNVARASRPMNVTQAILPVLQPPPPQTRVSVLQSWPGRPCHVTAPSPSGATAHSPPRPRTLQPPPNTATVPLNAKRLTLNVPRPAPTFADLTAAGLASYFELLQPATPLPALAAALQLAPADILHAGTDLQADVNAALAAGMRAAWLAPNTHFHPKGVAIVLRTLADLPEILRMADTAHLHRKPNSLGTKSLVAMLRDVPGYPPPGPGRRHYEPEQLVGKLILDVASKLRSELGPMEVLREHWLELIGKPNLAASSAPEKITPTGTLCIHCSDVITREELSRWSSRRILESVKRLPTCSKVRSLSFHV